MKLQYRIPLANTKRLVHYSDFALQGWLVPDEHMDASRDIGEMIALPLLVRPFFILLRIIFRKNSFKTKDMSDNHTVCVSERTRRYFLKEGDKKTLQAITRKAAPLITPEETYLHEIPSSD